MELFHDSNDPEYRCKAGALRVGEKTRLKLKCLYKDARAYLRLWWQNKEILIEMTRAGDIFEAEITMPEITGVMWYFFVVETDGKRLYYGNARDFMDGVGETYQAEPPGYQITVYGADYETPRWMRDSVIYQIMPDRFFCSKPLAERPEPYLGWLHADWNERVALPNGEADDFFGGDLKGIEQKLDYLKNLGVGAIYLNPIFRARSNHKYDTGDYTQIDPMFGSREDFESLCREAAKRGIRVMLDGVFSHTGAISRYFNIDGSYDSLGAYQSRDSRYINWYDFKNWPDDYNSWWGFKTLPNVNEMDEGFLMYTVDSESGVVADWIREGAGGWRLDVADELPMEFIRKLRNRAKATNPEAAVLGEVWEDASNKLAYGKMRSYCLGDTLDSVMNYPLRDMAIGFMLFDIDSGRFARRLTHMKNAYPAPFFYSLMNLLGSHDKPRVIDVLSGDANLEPPRKQRFYRQLPPEKYELGKTRYIALWRFICSLPGMPCVYYADEAGQTGMADPFCRATYPWGAEDKGLIEAIGAINRERNASEILKRGDMRLYAPAPDVIVCCRFIKNNKDALGDEAENGTLVCALNRASTRAAITIEPDDALKDGFQADLPPMSALTRKL